MYTSNQKYVSVLHAEGLKNICSASSIHSRTHREISQH